MSSIREILTDTSAGPKSNLNRTTSGQGSYLDIPPSSRNRQASIDSTFAGTNLSELSFRSDEPSLSRRQSLTRTVSNVSSVFSPPSTGWRQTLQDLYIANYGALLVMSSQFFGALMNLSTRVLETPGSHGEPMHPFQILFTRQLATALICTTYALWTKSIPYFPLGPPGVRWLLVSRGLCGFFGVFGLYFSLVYLPLSEATVLTFLAPILTCYACSILMPGETFSRQQQMAGCVSLLGVLFIAQPASLFKSPATPAAAAGTEAGIPPSVDTVVTGEAQHDHGASQVTSGQHLMAIGIAMVGVLGATGAMTSIRAIGTRAHAFISVNYFSVWSTIVSLIALIVSPDVKFRLPGNLQEWGLLSILGSCGFILQSLLTMGLAYGGPSSTGKDKGLNRVSTNPDIEMQAHLHRHRGHDHNTAQTNSPTGPPSTQLAEQQRPTSPQPPRRRTPKPPQAPPKGSGTKATAMVYTQMLFALAGDKLVFGVTPSVWSWVGSGLILAGAVWVATATDGATPKPKPPEPGSRTGVFGSGNGAGGSRSALASVPEVLARKLSRTAEAAAAAAAIPAAREEEVGLLRDVDGDRVNDVEEHDDDDEHQD